MSDSQPPCDDDHDDLVARVRVLESKVEQLLGMLNEMVDRVNNVSTNQRRLQRWK